MVKARTVGQKWLANELDLHFLTLKSVPKANSFKSYRANKLQIYRQTDIHTDRQPAKQTDTFVKTIFSGSEGLKTWTFDKKRGGGGSNFTQI